MSDTIKECPVCGFHFWKSVGCPNGCKTAVDSGAGEHISQQSKSQNKGSDKQS